MNPGTTFTQTNAPNTCATCHYFKRFTRPNPTLGECHADPPIIWQNGKADTRMGVWPIVPDTEGCGFYQERRND